MSLSWLFNQLVVEFVGKLSSAVKLSLLGDNIDEESEVSIVLSYLSSLALGERLSSKVEQFLGEIT